MELKITDNEFEMIKLGQEIVLNNKDIFSTNYINKIYSRFEKFVKDKKRLDNLFYGSVYCWYMYGTSILEYATFHFKNKSHNEKIKYITWVNRYLYSNFLNRERDMHLLDNKYEAYNLLKKYYKRDAMLLSDENDFDAFCSFVLKYKNVYVKPNNLAFAEGVHELNFKEGDNIRQIFNELLYEAKNLNSIHVKRQIDHRLIIEEKITPSNFINKFNQSEISILRVSTISIKDNVLLFYPCFRILTGDGNTKRGEDYSYVALIDSNTGMIITNGISGLGEVDRSPITGEFIKGTLLPDWNELKKMLEEAAMKLNTLRYIGWDVAHTSKGWCIIEGNTNGEFFFQMCLDHGIKDEFEDIIGFHIPFDFQRSSLFNYKRGIMP